MTPGLYTDDLSERDKITLIENYGDRQKTVGTNYYYLEVYDLSNGFLYYTGGYEGLTEFCYWNLSNGKKLIASRKGGCGPLCDYNLDFLIFDDGNFQPIESRVVLPHITFEDFFNAGDMEAEGVDVEAWKTEFDKFDLIYNLPREGRNIIGKSQFNDFADLPERDIDRYTKGIRIELKWDDGSFLKGKVY